MNDLATFLFAMAAGTLFGYCFGHFYRTARRAPHRPQRTPRYPWS